MSFFDLTMNNEDLGVSQPQNQMIYHERQESALCGVHCLNNLFQGPMFGASDLSEIALELDAQEREYMLAEGFNTPDALKFLAEGSGNVDASGNFSIQVLSVALRNFELELVPWYPKESEDPSTEIAFVLNNMSHWYTIRKINDHWWDLNSLNRRPVHITPFYLHAYLGQLIQDGFSVFVVKSGNAFSSLSKRLSLGESSEGTWYREGDLLQGRDSHSSQQHAHNLPTNQSTSNNYQNASSLSFTGNEDDDISLAIALSLSEQK